MKRPKKMNAQILTNNTFNVMPPLMLKDRFNNVISLLSSLSVFAAQILPTLQNSAHFKQHNPQILMVFRCSHLLFENIKQAMWESESLESKQY